MSTTLALTPQTVRVSTFRVPPTVVLSFAVVVLVLAWSLVPGLFTTQDPVTGDTSEKLLGPSAAHWFGTDHLGRDLFARVVHGTSSSVVLDEPTSALDVTVQAGIVGVLVQLQRELGLTYLFVSPDLALVRQFADTVTVLRHCLVVEEGTVDQVLLDPQDDYSRALVAAIPRPTPAGGGYGTADLVPQNGVGAGT